MPMHKIWIDQMGRQLKAPFPPQRIVSLVPSQTELLFHLGLDQEVVGLTKFCIHPEHHWRNKPRIGGTKKLHLDRISELEPDLIIGNKEENERGQIEALEKDFPVWMSDILTIDDALEMIGTLSELVDRRAQGIALVDELSPHFAAKPFTMRPKAAYLIWRQPWMGVGSQTFIDSMLNCAGFKNILAKKTRYPEISLEELSRLQPDVVMLSSEPYPFKDKHLAEIQEHCPQSIVKLVDGELFSWYGSRMLKAAPYFAKLHAEIVSMLS